MRRERTHAGEVVEVDGIGAAIESDTPCMTAGSARGIAPVIQVAAAPIVFGDDLEPIDA